MLAGSLVIADVSALPVIGLMTMGIVIAIAGHIGRNYRVVGLGIALLFVSTALMIISGFSAFNGNESDPRPCTTALC